MVAGLAGYQARTSKDDQTEVDWLSAVAASAERQCTWHSVAQRQRNSHESAFVTGLFRVPLAASLKVFQLDTLVYRR